LADNAFKSAAKSNGLFSIEVKFGVFISGINFYFYIFIIHHFI
jgi:hypothetical protein